MDESQNSLLTSTFLKFEALKTKVKASKVSFSGKMRESGLVRRQSCSLHVITVHDEIDQCCMCLRLVPLCLRKLLQATQFHK